MVVIAIIVGAVLGAVWERDFSVVAGALLGWLIVQSLRQKKDSAGLQPSLQQLGDSYNEREAQAALKALPPGVGVSEGIKLALKALNR